MPIIKGFDSTTIWKAFILNSLAASIAIVVAIYVKMKYDTFIDEDGKAIREVTNTRSLVLTFGATFVATIVAYVLLHIVFGYGGGQLTEK